MSMLMSHLMNAIKPIEKPTETQIVITATYHLESTYRVPVGVKLMSEEEMANYNYDEKLPGMWWIRWETLYYYDDNLERQSIEPEYSAKEYGSDEGYKRPCETYMTEEEVE